GGLLLEAGLQERGLLLLNAGLLQVDLLTEVLLLRRNRHAGLPDRVQDAHLTNRVQIEGRLDPRQLFDLLCAGCGNGRKPRGLGRRLHRLGQPTLTRRGHLGHWGPRRVLWLEARHWWLQGACPRNRNGLIGTHPSAWLAQVRREGGDRPLLEVARLGLLLLLLRRLRHPEIWSRRPGARQHPAEGPVAAQRRHRHPPVTAAGRLSERRSDGEDEVGAYEGDERHADKDFFQAHLPTSSHRFIPTWSRANRGA